MSNAADHGGSQPKTTPRAATPTPPSPQTGARQSVRLRLGGATAEDIARARNAATRHPSYNSWTIDVTEKNVGTPSTIPPGRPRSARPGRALRVGMGRLPNRLHTEQASIMSEEFAVCCMGNFCGHVDVGRAAKMYVQNPLERTGDLEQGFSYWIPGPNVEHLVRVDVQPMSRTGAARV